jgi:apolipoprotein N-acyltransferase
MSSFRRTITVSRQAAGSHVNGIWTPGTTTTTTIQASVQPATARDMERLPEGRRQTGAVKVYTSAALLVEQGTQKADRIILPSGTYEVAQADEWQNGVLPHNAYLCARVV